MTRSARSRWRACKKCAEGWFTHNYTPYSKSSSKSNDRWSDFSLSSNRRVWSHVWVCTVTWLSSNREVGGKCIGHIWIPKNVSSISLYGQLVFGVLSGFYRCICATLWPRGTHGPFFERDNLVFLGKLTRMFGPSPTCAGLSGSVECQGVPINSLPPTWRASQILFEFWEWPNRWWGEENKNCQHENDASLFLFCTVPHFQQWGHVSHAGRGRLALADTVSKRRHADVRKRRSTLIPGDERTNDGDLCPQLPGKHTSNDVRRPFYRCAWPGEPMGQKIPDSSHAHDGWNRV